MLMISATFWKKTFFTTAQCENTAEVWILKNFTCQVQTPDTPKHWKVLLAALRWNELQKPHISGGQLCVCKILWK